MKLGMAFPVEWKTLSEQSGMALSDILYGYAVEDLMVRLEKSSFHENMWIINEDALTEAAFGKKVKQSLSFYYKETGKKTLDSILVETILIEVKEQDRHGIFWTHTVEEKGEVFFIHLEAHYKEMKVPMVMTLEVVPQNAQSPREKSMELRYVSKRSYKYYTYSKESILAENLFEMLRKLELVGDMSPYSIVNDILKRDSISGRHILEEFRCLGEKEPKVVNLKRLEQIERYRDYAYMEKKWQQYEKRQGRVPEEWSTVLNRVLKFLVPTWKAFCQNEVFFDDWMPELERFLG
ncbi:MAG: hypothetical protein J6B96_03250 [Agathobacter sp.]|nr:hypothetical protein [Agathobacter sp.]